MRCARRRLRRQAANTTKAARSPRSRFWSATSSRSRYAGFAWTTPIFIVGWLLLGGLRRPLLIALTSILGTAGVLYFFVKVSTMPLDRGRDVFEQATLTLYRLLGIY